tara:strand:- start:1014 stop:1535 length:522 start_codon:yes stop_codon:yes gene_type:complete
MKKFFLFIIIFILLLFCFIVFFKGLNKSTDYIPNDPLGKKLVTFKGKDFFNNQGIISDELFDENKFYLINIWASWCLPCRVEHKSLMKLNKNTRLKIIGINYKDDIENAHKFLNEKGNPYSIILKDKDGTISIELGAYGVPETLIVNKKKIILKKFIGPINDNNVKEIERIIE